MTTRLLPEAFAALEPLVAEWGQPTSVARAHKRIDTEDQIERLREFYQRMLPHMEAVVDHLNQTPLDALGPQDRRLLDLVLMFAEAGHFVEFRWRRWFDPRRMVETRILPHSDH